MKVESEVPAPCSVQANPPTLSPMVGGEPQSPSEKYLASLWAEIIGLDGEQLRLPHKFLEVGGNSLTLNIILTRIEAETGAALEPEWFFDDERSSLFALARELDGLRGAAQIRSV